MSSTSASSAASRIAVFEKASKEAAAAAVPPEVQRQRARFESRRSKFEVNGSEPPTQTAKT